MSLRSDCLKLRLEGKSYNEINKELGVPKSTLSSWFTGLVLSTVARQRLKGRVYQGTLDALVRRNHLQTHKSIERAKKINREASKEVKNFKKSDLLAIGAILYWAEGYKRLRMENGKEKMSHAISFVNADPIMVRIFVRFLMEVMDIPGKKINLHMRLYAHINEKTAMCYWIKSSGLPGACFGKSTFLVSGASKGRRPFTRLPYGTLQIEVNSTEKFHRLMGFIEGVKNQF